MATGESEIAGIEEKLARLRARRDTLVSSVRYYVPFAIIAGALVACFLVYSIAIKDIAAVVTAVLILLVLLAMAIFSRLAVRHKRLYDGLVNARDIPDRGVSVGHIERDIAELEARLAELRRQST